VAELARKARRARRTLSGRSYQGGKWKTEEAGGEMQEDAVEEEEVRSAGSFDAPFANGGDSVAAPSYAGGLDDSALQRSRLWEWA
jgi:hypothetical protein